MGDLQTAAGSIHPGKPVIWPQTKPQSQTQQESQTQTQETSTSSSQSSSQSTTAAQSSQAASSATAPSTAVAIATASASTAPASQAVRELTVNDVTSHLASINIPATEANVKLASLMLRFGIELSSDNFLKANALTEGTSKSSSTQEAAMVLLTKGITNSSEAVKMLSNQLSDTPNVTGQLSALNASLAQLAASIQMNAASFSPALLSQLTSMIGQFAAIMDDLPKKYKFGTEGTSAIGRDDLMNDIRALSSLLDGIQNQALSKEAAATPENEAARSAITASLKRLGDLLENLTSQALLSQRASKSYMGQQDDYLYYQIPNTMLTPPSSVEIIIKQDPTRKNSVDLSNTHIAIGLETEALGKMVVSIMVKDKNVKMLFNTEQEDTKKLCDSESINLKTKLTEKGYKVEECSARVNKTMCSIKPFLIPLLGLERLFRIDSTI
ncbi:MAG: flagellar hook-length control protein FliK [Candidatus Margulisiibacteriota bacterium]